MTKHDFWCLGRIRHLAKIAHCVPVKVYQYLQQVKKRDHILESDYDGEKVLKVQRLLSKNNPMVKYYYGNDI